MYVTDLTNIHEWVLNLFMCIEGVVIWEVLGYFVSVFSSRLHNYLISGTRCTKNVKIDGLDQPIWVDMCPTHIINEV